MCGFVAQISKQALEPDKKMISKMAEDIHHRGPDDTGFYYDDWFGLGFKRLSIIDLSKAAHQPMFDENKRFVIVYNGEIYNFKDIRQELFKEGYNFFSSSDTEVVLKSYMAWGQGCLSKFVGMFAFLIVDLLNDKVFAARDQLGIKPLYFYHDKNNLLLASEIKCFRHYLKFGVNDSALYEQFIYRYVSGRQTIYKDIYRLLPGNYLESNKHGDISEVKYYDVTDSLLNSERLKIDQDVIEEELKKSIYAHTQSDVGYNIQLSGGLDSSYITAVLSKDYNQRLNTYSVELKEEKCDEGPYQAYVSTKFNVNHHGFTLDGKDLADNLQKATWHFDFPIVHSPSTFLMLLCKHSRDNSKVILTGEGADELFGGYSRYNIPFPRRFSFLLKRFGVRPEIFPNFGKFGSLRFLLSQEIGMDEQILFSKEAMLKMLRMVDQETCYRRQVADKFHDLLRRIIASDQTSYLCALFERQDKMAMAMSVETRVPFCTFQLFDLINNLNFNDKITPEPKIILKKISERYFKSDFIYRRKIGFILPFSSWLRDRKKLGRYLDLLTDNTFKQRGFYDVAFVQRAIKAHLQEERDNSRYLINLIQFEIWHRMFIDV
ncbi:MAG: asparagine synthase (glutamine-hydrolyzing) [Candidatus Scalinduaceae bacterium]